MIDRREFGKAGAGAMAIAASAAIAAGPGLASAQQTHKWKMQSLWQAGSVNQKVFEDWAKRVKEASGGRIEIEPLAVGTIVGYGETLDAMTNGVLDSHHSGGPVLLGQGARARADRRPQRRLREPRTRCSSGSSTGAGSSWPARSTGGSTSSTSARSGGAWSRCRPRGRCGPWPTSRA